jgi:hypothetical protein
MLLHPKPVDAALIAALRRDFAARGDEVLDTLRNNRPDDYFKLTAFLLGSAPPSSPYDGVSSERLAAIIDAAQRRLDSPDDGQT